MSGIKGPTQLKILIVLEKISVADYFGHKFPIGNVCHTCDRLSWTTFSRKPNELEQGTIIFLLQIETRAEQISNHVAGEP